MTGVLCNVNGKSQAEKMRVTSVMSYSCHVTVKTDVQCVFFVRGGCESNFRQAWIIA